MRTHWTSTVAACCFLTIALFLSAREPDRPVNVNVYLHGGMTCMQGDGAPGTRLFLRRNVRCEGGTSYPYLEVDIRELPILVHKNINIGPDNWAFRCLSPKESCQQSVSGRVVFNHLETHLSGEEIQTDGDYELRFNNGPSESGRFKVDCAGTCG